MKFTCFLPLAFGLMLAGCGGSTAERLAAENDSLRNQVNSQSKSIENYLTAIETINATLDSIDVQDKLIFASDTEGTATRDMVLANLDRFEMVILKQQHKIRDLERRLEENEDSSSAAKSLISHLQAQIASKNRQISRLKKELEDKNIDIARLQARVEQQNITITTQTATITELTTRNRKQGEALARQDAILNNGYVLIGTKDDLSRKGIIKKGRVVSDAALDRSKFFQVDIRQWKEISFRAKKPRILTNMPASSYELTTSGDRNFTLRITDPSNFWRISNYLIIQTN